MAEKSGVQSVERIFQLIEHLAAHPTGVSLQRLAEETGLAKSTVHRLLASLVGLGYVVQDEENGHYRLTLKMFELSSGIVDSMDIMGVAKAHLERLSQRTGEAVHLVIRDGRDIVYIYKTESGPMRMSSRVGLRSPLYCTGVGKAILATLPGDELEDIWTHSNVQKLTDKTITDLEELRSQLVEVRANGYAIDDEENELILPKAEQIPNDFYRKGDTIKAIVKSVEMNNNQPRIILSRTANQFLERLFEQEVPEIFDGLITLKKIVRIPGERAKVAVESYDERIDPVGACVGMKGSRIYSIVKELRNENIDVVNYTANPSLMIQRALNPAKISSITIDEEKMTASVYLKPDQVSLAIGKGGLNIRLSKMLTGYDIDVYREVEEEDVALTEFADEIDGWVIDALKACGCDTAKSVLELPVEEIAARADLELEQAQKVVEILKAEFEE